MRPATTTGELLPGIGSGDFQTMFLPEGPSQSSGIFVYGEIPEPPRPRKQGQARASSSSEMLATLAGVSLVGFAGTTARRCLSLPQPCPLTVVAAFPSAAVDSIAFWSDAFSRPATAATWPSGLSATVACNGTIKPTAVAARMTNSPLTVHRAAGVQVASQSCCAATGSSCGCFRRRVAAHLAAASETMIPPHNSPAPKA